MHVTMVTTHHTQMCYMLHVQYTNRGSDEGEEWEERGGGVGGERGRSGRREGEEWEERGGGVGGERGRSGRREGEEWEVI